MVKSFRPTHKCSKGHKLDPSWGFCPYCEAEARAEAKCIKDKKNDEISTKTKVFVSYSRRDSALVEHLVSLLRAVETPVFVDTQSIKPGAVWKAEIVLALKQCEKVLVFWCEHSAESDEVHQEYRLAISLEKHVVPVLVDTTEMPEELSRLQAVDLRRAIGGFHDILIKALAFEQRIRERTTPSMIDEGYSALKRAREKTSSLLPEVESKFLVQARQLLKKPFSPDASYFRI